MTTKNSDWAIRTAIPALIETHMPLTAKQLASLPELTDDNGHEPAWSLLREAREYLHQVCQANPYTPEVDRALADSGIYAAIVGDGTHSDWQRDAAQVARYGIAMAA